MAFPASLPSYTITAGSETANGAAGGTGLSGLLNAFEVDITALGTKLGTGASTAAAGQVLRGTGAGTSAWAQVVLATDVAAFTSANLASVVSDETGTGLLVFNNSPTIVTPTIASFTNAQHNHGSAAGGGAIVAAALPTGSVVQMVSTTYTVAATGTTTIPTDDTIPQSTEGDQYMTQTITPLFSNSTLKVEVVALCSNSAGISDLTMALFQDSGANAIAATVQTQAASTYEQNLKINHPIATGATTATTFKVRIGNNAAGTTTFGGQAGARKFGGINIASIIITEVKG